MIGWRVIPAIGIGRFTVSPHGVAIAIGFYVGTVLTARKARSKGLNDDNVWNAAGAGIIGAIIGARAAYVIGHHSDFSSVLEWIEIWKGGLSIIGSLIGGFLAGYLYTRRKGIDFFEIADLGMPFLALGIAIGRVGDLMIGDHLGKQTSGWWGWKYKGGELISSPPCIYRSLDGCIRPGMVVHQTALYDLIWSLVTFAILIQLTKAPRKRGFFFFTWASLYAIGRIATDFTRVDKHWFGLGLTGSQLTSLLVLAACIFLIGKYGGAPPVSSMGESNLTSAPEAGALQRNERPGEKAAVTDSATPRQEPTGLEPPAPTHDDPAPEPPPRPAPR